VWRTLRKVRPTLTPLLLLTRLKTSWKSPYSPFRGAGYKAPGEKQCFPAREMDERHPSPRKNSFAFKREGFSPGTKPGLRAGEVWF